MKKYKGYLLVLPSLVIMSALVFYPLAEAIWLSLTNDNPLIGVNNFIGIENYIKLFQDPTFLQAFFNSTVLTTLAVFCELVLGFLLALILQQEVPGIKFFRSVTMVGWAIPIIATVIMFQFMSQPNYGFINVILQKIGLSQFNTYFFGNLFFAMPSVIIINIWRNAPFFGIAFLAGLGGIPKYLYEAASIDGAKFFHKFFYITLPEMKSIISVMLIIHIIFTFNDFNTVYLATGGGPVNATLVLPIYLYEQAWNNFNFGYASSIGVFMLLILVAFFVLFNRFMTERI
ncbi:MAG: sugar ABC transporter permease [Nitrososphaeria archaeon]